MRISATHAASLGRSVYEVDKVSEYRCLSKYRKTEKELAYSSGTESTQYFPVMLFNYFFADIEPQA